MFNYLHCYMPETWEAQVKSGLINDRAGIRFVQTTTLEKERKFNELAKKDGNLYNILNERKCPFYIDRLQGGSYMEDYDYDFELIEEYKKMLGDKFWGFQMHEWMTNFLSDTYKIISGGCKEPWTEEKIKDAILKQFPFPYLFIESVTAKEMEEYGCIKDADAYIKAMYNLYEKRQRYTGGYLISCDSHGLGMKLELDMGTKRIMPEVGAQTPNSRIQIAYARGMGRTNKIPFGVYYEPWGGVPFSTCNYHREGQNEWNIGNEIFPFKSAGGNGGSSRSLQRRIHIYSYLAGAEFISEEWGMCNTFYDWNDFELTPYGEVKYDFIRFTEKYQNIGEIITPIAVVLPKELAALETVIDPAHDTYFGFPLSVEQSKNLRFIKKNLYELFCTHTGKIGPDIETQSMLNYKTPDAIDIIHEDKADGYDYYVDLTCSDSFARTHNCIKADEVNAVLEKVLPVTVKGNVHFFVNRAKDCFYLTLLNNTGVDRSVEDGEKLMKEADAVVEVSVKNERLLDMLEGNSKISKADGKYYICVPAGGWFFGRF